MPSPKKLKARTVRNSINPGSTATHQAVSKLRWPAFKIIPQLVTVGSPSPMKLSAASARMTPGIDRVAITMMGLMTLGIRWRKTIRLSLAPRDLDAMMNSLVLRDKVSLLTSLAVPVQPVRPIARMMKFRDGPKIKIMNTSSRKKGKVIIMSVNLIKAISATPP